MLFLNKIICSCITNVRVLKLHRIFVKIANEIGITSALQKKSVKIKLNIFSVFLIQNQCRFYTKVKFIIYSLNNSSFAHKFFKICGEMLTFFELHLFSKWQRWMVCNKNGWNNYHDCDSVETWKPVMILATGATYSSINI